MEPRWNTDKEHAHRTTETTLSAKLNIFSWKTGLHFVTKEKLEFL